MERKAFKTGLGLILPGNVEAQIRPRSGLAKDKGITVLNSPGTIDPDYRGEIKVILINLSESSQNIKKGDRIAQVIFSEFKSATFYTATEETSRTDRGSKGFGSTGK